MTTLNQLIFDIKLLLRGGRLISDDDPISNSQIAFWIHAARATLIRQQLDKGQSVSDNVLQPVIAPVEQVSTSFDPTVITDCSIVRTVNPIPKVIETKQADTLYDISAGVYGVIPYTHLPSAVMPYSKYNPFGKKMPKAYLQNGYLIIENIGYIENVYFEGIFANPEDVNQYNNGDYICFSPDDNYPISEHMIDPLKRMIMDTNFRYSIKILSDNTNNAEHNLEQPIK